MTHISLDTLSNNIKRLRKQLDIFGKDLNFKKRGGRQFYAVDFSEVYSYLDPMAELPGHLAVGLFVGNREHASQQYRLGLTHLFQKGFEDTVYLLPPHVLEMWSYVRYWGDEAEKDQSIIAQAQDMVARLTPKQQSRLQDLTQHKELNQSQLKELVDLVKDDFEELCLKVSCLTRYPSAYHRINNLKDLVKHRHLSYQIEDLFKYCNMPSPSEVFSPKEVEKVFLLFPEFSRESYPLNKRLDARALLYLGRANQILAENNAKLILITRDQGIISVAERFEGMNICSFLRSLDAVLFDFMLRGISDEDARLQTVKEMDQRLDYFERSANTLSNELNNSDEWGLTEEGKNLIEEGQKSWDKHVNLRLSQAMPILPWLREAFKSNSVKSSNDELRSREIDLLRALGEVVTSDEYQKIANHDITDLWMELLDDGMRSLFAGILNQKGLDTVKQEICAQPRLNTTVLRSRRYQVYASLRFRSSLLAELSGELVESDEGHSRIRKAFVKAVRKVIEEPPEAEGFLFIGFILGLLDLWEEADSLARRSVELAGTTSAASGEAHYFQALVNRKMAEKFNDQPEKALQHLIHAFESIRKAQDCRGGRDDPRFLKELATIVLDYHDRSKDQGRVIQKDRHELRNAKHPSEVSRRQAIESLVKALPKVDNDRRLKVAILNNLAYSSVHSDDVVSLEKAQQYVDQMEKEFEEGRNEHEQPPQLPPEPWMALRDTMLMVGAKRAWRSHDRKSLEKCISDAETILAKEDLPEREQGLLRKRSLERMRKWLEEL